MGSQRGDSGPSAGATAVGRLGVTEPLWTVPVLERAAVVVVPQLAGPEDDSVLGASQEPGPPRPCTSVHPAERVASPTAGSGEGPPKPRVSPPAPHTTDRRWVVPQCEQACGPRDGHTCISSSLRPGLPDLVHRVWPRNSHADGGEVAPWSPLCSEGLRPASPPHPRLSPRPHGDPEHAWSQGLRAGETSRHDQVHGTQRVGSSCPQGEEVDQQAQGVCAGTRRGWQEAAGGGL